MTLIQINNMKKAIIVDIDGTLAKMKDGGRGPFDWHRVEEDDPVPVVCSLVRMCYLTYVIIVFSGRDSICMPATIDWLHKHDVPFDVLFMRPEGNNEKDSIIKRRLYEENVAGVYDVQFVLDDRNQVVDMWRKELGLTCFQVNYGDF